MKHLQHFTLNKTIGVTLILMGLLLIPFLNDFKIFIPYTPEKSTQVLEGLTAARVILILINVGLSFLVFSQEKNEDERVDKIRNYSTRHSFGFFILISVVSAIEQPDIEVLGVSMIVLVYYFLLFRLCLYRDSTVIYLNGEQLKEYGKKNRVKPIKVIGWSFFLTIIIGLIFTTVSRHFKMDDSLEEPIRIYLLIFIFTIHHHWNNSSHTIDQ